MVGLEEQIRHAVGEAHGLMKRGEYAGAARLLSRALRQSQELADPELVGEVEGAIETLGSQVTGRARAQFDNALAPTDALDHRASSDAFDIDVRVGFALIVCGSLAMTVGAFLPLWDSQSVSSNSVIQEGSGWAFISTAVLNLASLHRAYRGGRRTYSALILGAGAAAYALFLGLDPSTMTLCSAADPSQCEVADPGIGLYVCGVGGLVTMVGGFEFARRREHSPPVATGVANEAGQTVEAKTCPDCAEAVLAAASVCRYCGFRWEAAETEPIHG